MKTLLLTTAIFLGFTLVNGQTKETVKKTATPVKNVITTSQKPVVQKSAPSVSKVQRAPKKVTNAMPADKARMGSSSPAQKTKMVSTNPKSRSNPSGQNTATKTEEQKYTEDRITAKYKIKDQALIEKRKKEQAEKQKALKNK